MPATGPMKVLLMDDDEMIRDTSSLMLQHLGHEVATAKKGEEAIFLYFKAKKEGNPFDLAIMDIVIKEGMGGVETIKIMHSLSPDVNFIIASGYCDDISVAELKRYGVNGLLRKPYSIPDLDKMLSKVSDFRP